MSQRYPTDLTDTQWTVITPFIPAAKPGGRPRTTNIREVVNALFDVLRGGCQWRLFPYGQNTRTHLPIGTYSSTIACASACLPLPSDP
jgi:transposase